MQELVSKKYKEKITALHKQRKWGGNVSRKIPDRIKKYMTLSRTKSILDYGAGYGAFKQAMLGKYDIHEYEPGIIGKDEDPPICDVTVCFDVLEHVEPGKIDNVLKHMYDKTRYWALVNICTIPAGQHFPDGQNLHLLVRESNWWLEKLKYDWEMFNIKDSGKHLEVLLIKK